MHHLTLLLNDIAYSVSKMLDFGANDCYLRPPPACSFECATAGGRVYEGRDALVV